MNTLNNIQEILANLNEELETQNEKVNDLNRKLSNIAKHFATFLTLFIVSFGVLAISLCFPTYTHLAKIVSSIVQLSSIAGCGLCFMGIFKLENDEELIEQVRTREKIIDGINKKIEYYKNINNKKITDITNKKEDVLFHIKSEIEPNEKENNYQLVKKYKLDIKN